MTTHQIDTVTSVPVEEALKINAQFIIYGTIREFELIDYAAITTQADRYKEQRICKEKLLLTLKETKSGKILFQQVFTGEVSQKIRNDNDWKAINKIPFDFDEPQFVNSLPGSALDQILDDAAEKISQKMGN